MKKKLKIILCIALIVLIALVSFIGVYTKDGPILKNNLPNYELASEFKGKRVTTFTLSTATEELIYDAEGNKVDAIPEGANEEDYTKETINVNKDEELITENYKKVKEIFVGRLESLGVQDYLVRVDETTGKVVVELEDNFDTDTILQYLVCNGDFSITDSEDGTILLDKSDVKEAKILYSNASSSGVTVYLDIKFNSEGKKKLAEVSKEYLKVEDETEIENEDTENEETENTETQRQVTLTLEGNKMLTTNFGEEITNGELTISLGSGTDTDTLQSYIEQGSFYTMLINNPEMPLTYEISTSNLALGNLLLDNLYKIIIVVIIIIAIIVIYIIYKFRIDGLLATLSVISFIAILLLAIRYTMTQVSLNAIVAIIVLILLNAYLLIKMLNKIKNDTSYENVAKTTLKIYLENIEIIIVALIVGIVFTFMNKVALYSFGMTMFYGIISIAISNLIFLRTMLLAKYSNK